PSHLTTVWSMLEVRSFVVVFISWICPNVHVGGSPCCLAPRAKLREWILVVEGDILRQFDKAESGWLLQSALFVLQPLGLGSKLEFMELRRVNALRIHAAV